MLLVSFEARRERSFISFEARAAEFWQNGSGVLAKWGDVSAEILVLR
jgi:hypothetical protein